MSVVYTIEKCDRGIPLPPDSDGTWFTWDIREDGRSITRHGTREEAEKALDILSRHPSFRALLRTFVGAGMGDGAFLDALEAAYDKGREDGRTG